MSAGRNVPGWAVGLSIFGTYVSSISFLALPSKAYASDWNPFVFSLTLPLTAWIAVRYFVPFYRRANALSSYEHLEQRFGPWARTYAVGCYLLTQLARMGTIMYLLALALAPLTGWSVPILIVLTGAVVMIYTLYGGMAAVIWTDVAQSVVFIVGAVACLAAIAFGMPHGPGELGTIATANHKFSLGSFSSSVSQATFWVVLLYGVFINLQNFGIDQSYVQRYQTAGSAAAARRSVWVGALLYLPTSAVFLFIGTGLFAFYTARPNLLPASLTGRPDEVFPHFIAHELKGGLAGLVVAAILAAAQSTISSSITGSATLLYCDVYQRYFQPHIADDRGLRILRVMSLVVGVAGTVAALAMMQIRSALDVWWQLAGILSGGMLGLFLLGRLAPRARSRDAATGVIAGVLVILWMTWSPSWPDSMAAFRSPLHNNLTIVVGTLTILATGVMTSAIAAARD
jgi:SSS family solute:Na+ symporter